MWVKENNLGERDSVPLFQVSCPMELSSKGEGGAQFNTPQIHCDIISKDFNAVPDGLSQFTLVGRACVVGGPENAGTH